MFLMQVCFDLTMLLVAYFVTDRFLIPSIRALLGEAVSGIMPEDYKENTIDSKISEDDEAYVPIVTHKFNSVFYSLAAVTPYILSPFTSSPNLVSMYLDNCEDTRERSFDKDEDNTGEYFQDTINDGEEHSEFITSPIDIARLLDEIENSHISNDDSMDQDVSEDVLGHSYNGSSFSFMTSPGDISRYLDDNEEVRFISTIQRDITVFSKLPPRRTLNLWDA